MKILNINEVVEETGLSKSTIQRLIESGNFPTPMKLSTNRIGWKEDDITKWYDELETA